MISDLQWEAGTKPMEVYKSALESAIVAVSERRLLRVPNSPRKQLARRVEKSLKELDKLSHGEVPNYEDPDVNLFCSHWYLPEQVNLAYTLSSQIIEQRRKERTGQYAIQLIDFGSGSGAMAIGLLFAIASQLPRDEWPDIIGVYPIDTLAMRALGDDVWQSLAAEARGPERLAPLSSLISRTLFEQSGNVPDPEMIWTWPGADRWLTALHVVYDETMSELVTTHTQLRSLVMPHVSVVTAPKLKADRVKDCVPVQSRLDGNAEKIRSHRLDLASNLKDEIDPKWQAYLNNRVRWASKYGNKRPFASTAVRKWGSS